MGIFKVKLDCDHEVMVLAENEQHALAIAEQEAGEHGAKVDGLPEDVGDGPGLLVIYPGPFSADAVVDRHVVDDD